jgi:hypothetical protein
MSSFHCALDCVGKRRRQGKLEGWGDHKKGETSSTRYIL